MDHYCARTPCNVRCIIFPFHLPSSLLPCVLPVPSLKVGPLNPTRGSGEHSPSGFWGTAQAEMTCIVSSGALNSTHPPSSRNRT